MTIGMRRARRAACRHEWLELGNRRFCVTHYGGGGCAGTQTRAHAGAPWQTAEEDCGNAAGSPPVIASGREPRALLR